VRPFHRHALPAEVRSQLRLPSRERPLASAVTQTGLWWVGTRGALLVPDAGAYLRLPWESIDRASWDNDSRRLVVVEVAEYGQVNPRRSAVFDDASILLRLIRERVTASVVVSRFVPVNGRRGLSVVGRRAPGTDGPVSWSFVIDPGLDVDDPLVRAAADSALEAAEQEL